MNGPTPHLAWKELACHDGTEYPLEWRADRLPILANEFERVRIIVGGQIVIGSAFRTPTYNAKIGGAKNSQHCEGRALDLYPPPGMPIDTFYRKIRDYAMSTGSEIRGLGRYPTFVHIDVRPIADNRLVVWTGTRPNAEVLTKDNEQEKT